MQYRIFETTEVTMLDKDRSPRLHYEALKKEAQIEMETLLVWAGNKDRPPPTPQLPFSDSELEGLIKEYFGTPSGMHSWMLICLSCGKHSLVNPRMQVIGCYNCSSKKLISGDELVDRVCEEGK